MAETRKMSTINRWLWWQKGECVVEVLRVGHFPTTVMVKLPNDKVIEMDFDELSFPRD
jgi:hypothetical protein